MKRLLFVASILFAGSSFAQNPTIGTVEHLDLPEFDQKKAIDTLDQYLLRSSGATLTGNQDGGYIVGTSYYDNMGTIVSVSDEIAMHYDGVTGASVTEILVWFGANVLEGTADNVTANVHSVNADSSSASILGSSVLASSAITAGTSFTLTSFPMSSPVNTNGNPFLCGINVAGVNDTLGIVTSSAANNDGANEARLRTLTTATFGGLWTALGPLYGGYNADAFIMPVVDIVAGVDAQSNGLSVGNIFPNPTNDIANLNFSLENAADISIRVFNLMGEELYTESATRGAGQHTIVLETQNWAAGNYYFTVSSSDGAVITSKFNVTK